MPSIASKVDDVLKLYFEPIPSSKKLSVVAMARVENTYVFVDANGRIYSNQCQERTYYHLGGKNFEPTLRACIKLGLLSKKAVDQHQKYHNELRERDERRWAANDVKASMLKLGLVLTKHQCAVIEAAEKKGGDE